MAPKREIPAKDNRSIMHQNCTPILENPETTKPSENWALFVPGVGDLVYSANGVNISRKANSN